MGISHGRARGVAAVSMRHQNVGGPEAGAPFLSEDADVVAVGVGDSEAEAVTDALEGLTVSGDVTDGEMEAVYAAVRESGPFSTKSVADIYATDCDAREDSDEGYRAYVVLGVTWCAEGKTPVGRLAEADAAKAAAAWQEADTEARRHRADRGDSRRGG